MERSRPMRWLDEMWDSLTEHDGMWIAVGDDGFLEADEDLGTLIASLDASENDRRKIVFSFVCLDTLV